MTRDHSKKPKGEFILPSTKGKASKAGDLGNRSRELTESPNADRLTLRKFSWEQ